MKEKKKHYKLKYYIFRTLDVLIAITPLIIFLCRNLDKYFGTKTTTISNIFGLVILAGVLVIVLLKKTQILNGLVGLIVLELILIFLDVYIKDMKYILGCGLIGLLISKFSTNILVMRYKRLSEKQETAQENAEALNSGLNNIVSAIERSWRG